MEVGLQDGVAAKPEKKPKGTVTKDPELVAMNKIVGILTGLDSDETRKSVLDFVGRKFRGLAG